MTKMYVVTFENPETGSHGIEAVFNSREDAEKRIEEEKNVMTILNGILKNLKLISKKNGTLVPF